MTDAAECHSTQLFYFCDKVEHKVWLDRENVTKNVVRVFAIFQRVESLLDKKVEFGVVNIVPIFDYFT